MKTLKLLRTAPGAALAIAMIVTSGAGAFALSNWFNGTVGVKQDSSVFSVDLSSCKGNMPPGVSNSDRSNIQFKILGDPHISKADLQSKLLAECEFNAVLDFYRSNPATAQFYLPAGTIKTMTGNEVTIAYLWGGRVQEKTFALAQGATAYKEGATVNLADIHQGDTVVFAVEAQQLQEGTDPFNSVTEVKSVFKTKYDINTAPGASKKGFYDESNIMPLDWYNQINK